MYFFKIIRRKKIFYLNFGKIIIIFVSLIINCCVMEIKTTKSQLTIWILILVATVLIIGTLVYLLVSKVSGTKVEQLTNLETTKQNPIQYFELVKDYSGIKRTSSGLTPAMLSISKVDSANKSFFFALNISTSEYYQDSGFIDLNYNRLSTTKMGDLSISRDTNNRIVLATSLNNQVIFNFKEENK